MLKMISGLKEIGVKIWGITDSSKKRHRAPTVSFTHHSMSAEEIGSVLRMNICLGREFLRVGRVVRA